MTDVNVQNAGDPGDGGHVTQQQTDIQAQTEKLGWKTELPESLRTHEAFQNYQTKNDLWNGHIELAGKLKDAEGRLVNSIPKLTADATDEQKAAYRAALGIPDKAEDYEVELVDGMDATLADWFRQTALALGMPKDMAKGLSAQWNVVIQRIAQTAQEAEIKAHDEALSKLKQDWGDDAEKNAETIKQGYKFFGSSPAFDELMRAEITIGDRKVKVGNHPGMVNLILEIGKKVSPDSALAGNPAGGQIPGSGGVIHYDWGKTNGG